MSKILEIEQDHSFQKKFWKFQNFGKVFLILFFITALIGLLGSGPLSFKEQVQGNIKIKFPYLTRFSHPETLKLTIYDTRRDTVDIIISRSYLENVSIEKIIPEPVEESLYKDYIQFSFVFSESRVKEIFFNIQYRSGGKLNGEIGLKNESVISINQIVFP